MERFEILAELKRGRFHEVSAQNMEYVNSGGRGRLSYAAYTYCNKRGGRRDNISTREREQEVMTKRIVIPG